MDYKSPDSSVHGILQARILEWVAISFSWGSSQTRDRTWVSRTAGGFFTIQALGCPLHQLNTNSSPHSPQSSIPSFFFLFLWVWVFYIFHMNGTVQYLSFCNWLISLNVTSSMFTQVVVCDRIPSVFKAEYSPIMCVSPFCFSTYVSGHLGCFHLEKLILIVIRACLSGFWLF